MTSIRPRETAADAPPARSEAASSASGGTAASSAEALSTETTCVVCLQPCRGNKACACSFMHQQCAEAYKKTYGACRVCSVDFSPVIFRLNKRHVEDDEAELEMRALKKRRVKEDAEKVKNLEWARTVAPSAAHILYRHFRHAGNVPPAELGFGTIILSLIHSGEQYIEDLAERLSETRPREVVDEAVRRLQNLAEASMSAEGVDEACCDEFMRHFNTALAERTSAPFRWNE